MPLVTIMYDYENWNENASVGETKSIDALLENYLRQGYEVIASGPYVNKYGGGFKLMLYKQESTDNGSARTKSGSF